MLYASTIKRENLCGGSRAGPLEMERSKPLIFGDGIKLMFHSNFNIITKFHGPQ